jgi:leucyl-tRNA synthetase
MIIFMQKLPKHMQLRDSLQTERALATMIIILSPLAPHFASEMWSAFVDNAQKLATDIDWVSRC